MALSNEISSEIAMAILVEKQPSSLELNQLKEVILLVHGELQKLSEDARAQRIKSHTSPRVQEPPRN
jgi:hypothetical protein